jgi:hypothetical protein
MNDEPTPLLTPNNMREYLNRVIPFDNEHKHIIVLGRSTPQPKSWLQWGVRTPDEAENVLLRELEVTPTANLYVSMASFTNAKGMILPTEWTPLRGVREKVNAFALKSLFLDIDVGEGKGYRELRPTPERRWTIFSLRPVY